MLLIFGVSHHFPTVLRRSAGLIPNNPLRDPINGTTAVVLPKDILKISAIKTTSVKMEWTVWLQCRIHTRLFVWQAALFTLYFTRTMEKSSVI